MTGWGSIALLSEDHHHTGASGHTGDGKKQNQFPSGYRGLYSALLSNPGGLTTPKVTVGGVSGEALTKYFSEALCCVWEEIIFTHSFLIMPENPTPLLGRDTLSQITTTE